MYITGNNIQVLQFLNSKPEVLPFHNETLKILQLISLKNYFGLLLYYAIKTPS